jgi:hypothetical protein
LIRCEYNKDFSNKYNNQVSVKKIGIYLINNQELIRSSPIMNSGDPFKNLSEKNFALVIDNGTGFCKAGLADEDAPRCCFPTIVGRLKLNPIFDYCGRESYIGDGV